MLTLPIEIMLALTPFMQVFSRLIWDWVQVLGAVLAPGKRTVTAILQVMGLRDERQYTTIGSSTGRVGRHWPSVRCCWVANRTQLSRNGEKNSSIGTGGCQ